MKNLMNNTCRSCAYQSNDMISLKEIFNKYDKSAVKKTVAEVLHECADIAIIDGDGMPNKMCTSCMNGLRSAYEYREMCRASDVKLREIIAEEASNFETFYIEPKIEILADDFGFSVVHALPTQEYGARIFEDNAIDDYTDLREDVKEDLIVSKVDNSGRNDDVKNFFEFSDEGNDHNKSDDYKDVSMDADDSSPGFDDGGRGDSTASEHEEADEKTIEESNYEQLLEKYRKKIVVDPDFIILRRAKIIDNRYVCEICDKALSDRKNLLYHIRIHLDIKLKRCDICNRGFPKRFQLKSHLEAHMKRPEEFSKYMETADSKRKVRKLDCQSLKIFNATKSVQRVQGDDALVMAKNADVVNGRFRCPLCGQTLGTRKTLVWHIRLHIGQNLRTCVLCKRGFVKSDHLKRHMRTHTKNMRNPCMECYEDFITSDLRDAHILECHENNSDTKIETRLAVKTTDLDAYKILGRANGKKNCNCLICDSNFSRISKLRKHLKLHGKNIDSFNDVDLQSKKALLFPTVQDLAALETDEMRSMIQSAINTGACESYYQITNHEGWELELSDSETESDDDDEENETDNDDDDPDDHDDSGMKMEFNRKVHPCSGCDRVYDRQYKLIAHMHYEHPEDTHSTVFGSFICGKCNIYFPNDAVLSKHERTQCGNSNKKFKCDKCICRFRWLESLEKHRSYMHSSQTFDCENCSESFSDRVTYDRHMESHHLFSCEICKIRFGRKALISDHMKRVHKTEYVEQTYPCEECTSTFPTRYQLRRHQLRQHEVVHLTCSECNKQFGRTHHLRRHMATIHGITTVGEIKTMEEILCDICGKKFTRRDHLRRHKLIHEPTDSVASYDCEICFKTFKRKDHMRQHLRTHETKPNREEESNGLLCSFCGASFKKGSNLNAHIRRHTNERPYKCDVCVKSFHRSTELVCHKRIHTGEKPYVCKVCEKGFSKSTHLRRHELIHTGLRPHKCTYCPKDFIQSNDLREHIRTHTGEKPYQCEECDQRFMRLVLLKRHQKKTGHISENGIKRLPITSVNHPHRVIVSNQIASTSTNIQPVDSSHDMLTDVDSSHVMITIPHFDQQTI